MLYTQGRGQWSNLGFAHRHDVICTRDSAFCTMMVLFVAAKCNKKEDVCTRCVFCMVCVQRHGKCPPQCEICSSARSLGGFGPPPLRMDHNAKSLLP